MMPVPGRCGAGTGRPWARFAVLLLVAGLTVLGGWGRVSAAGTDQAAAPAPEETASWVQEQLEGLDLHALQEKARQLQQELGRPVPGLDWEALRSQPLSGGLLEPRAALQALAGYLLRELWGNAVLLVQLVVLAVLLAFLENLAQALGPRSFQEAAFLVAYLALALLALGSFQKVLAFVDRSIQDMVGLVQALVPAFGSLLMAAGSISGSVFISPLILAVLGLLGQVVSTVVLPLFMVAAVLGLMGHLSEHFPLGRLAGLARQAGLIILGLAFTSLLGVLLVRGATAPVVDTVSIRSGKFMLKLVPVVGSMFADSLEVVAGYTQLARGLVGAFAMGVIFFLSAMPVLKTVALLFVYRLTGALLQPLANPRLSKALGEMEGALLFLAITTGVVAILTLISLSMLAGVGSMANGWR